MDSIFQESQACKLIHSNFPSTLGERVRVRGDIRLREKISKNVEGCEEIRQRLRGSSGQCCEIVNWAGENLEDNSLLVITYWISMLLNLNLV